MGKTMGILSISTFHSICLGECPLMSERDLQKHGRGSFDSRTDCNTWTHLLKRFDNKCIVVGSSFAGVECTNTVKKYDLAQKKNVKIDCPDMVSQYNWSMDGVDLADMLIALYGTNIITRKRCYLKFIFHCVDIAREMLGSSIVGIANKRKSQRNCRWTWQLSQHKVLLHLP